MGKTTREETTHAVSDRAGYDGNKPEFQPVRDYVYVDGRREPVDGPQNVNTTRIAWLFAHNEIDARQYEAGRRLQKDWHLSLIQPFASSVLVGAGGSGGNQLPNDAKVAAMKRHGNARAALGYGWAIIELVVHDDITIGKAAAKLHVGEKQAKGMLWLALHILADHYGLPKDQRV